MCLNQVLGAVAGALVANRDAAMARDGELRDAWLAAAAPGAAADAVAAKPDEAEMRASSTALGDAQLALERIVDGGVKIKHRTARAIEKISSTPRPQRGSSAVSQRR